MMSISIQKQLDMAEGRRTLSVDLEIQKGEWVVLFGKSGAGKTSLLRMISGLLKPDRGNIEWNNEVWFNAEKKIHLPVQKRKIGFIFQDLALFPNMTVMENLLFAAGKNKDDDYLEHLLLMTDMKTLARRKPQTLSGGQQQRAAIIRALARKPELLLLDEPFSALDEQMRNQLRKELKTLHREFRLTTLLVSHDVVDIKGPADKVIEIKEGKAICVPPVNDTSPMNEYRCTGNVNRIYGYESGFIVELKSGDEIFKIPVDELTANKLKQGSGVSIVSGSGHIRILPEHQS